MFDLKLLNPKAATKLVTLVTILGLASGCVHEQVKNDDPAMDLPALTLNDPAPESKGTSVDDLNLEAGAATEGAASVADASGIDTSLPAESSSMPLSNETSAPALSDSALPSDSSTNLAYSTPSELTPLAGSMMDDSASKSVKKAKKGKHKKLKIAKHGKRKAMKVAGGKKAKKIAKHKAKKDKAPVVAAIEPTQMPPAPPSSDALTIDGAPMDAATTTAAATTSAPTDSAMTLPADSEIGSHETTTIEPPLALSQAPDISSSDDNSIWIYWGAGMVILVGAVLLFVKRRRTAIRY